MAHTSYEESKKLVFKGMWILAAVTLIEVAISLFGKGYLGVDPKSMGAEGGINILLILVGIGLIVFSLYKAYYIVFKFMHMGHEAKGLRLTVLMPMLLLVWALIAFFQEGSSWKDSREKVNIKNANELNDLGKPVMEEAKEMD